MSLLVNHDYTDRDRLYQADIVTLIFYTLIDLIITKLSLDELAGYMERQEGNYFVSVL